MTRHGFKVPKTTQERRASEDYPELVRPARKPRLLPDYHDDEWRARRGHNDDYKNHRRK